MKPVQEPPKKQSFKIAWPSPAETKRTHTNGIWPSPRRSPNPNLGLVNIPLLQETLRDLGLTPQIGKLIPNSSKNLISCMRGTTVDLVIEASIPLAPNVINRSSHDQTCNVVLRVVFVVELINCPLPGPIPRKPWPIETTPRSHLLPNFCGIPASEEKMVVALCKATTQNAIPVNGTHIVHPVHRSQPVLRG